MDKKKVTLTIPWPNMRQAWTFARKWLLPNPGTLVLMAILVLAVPAIAGPSYAPSATSTSTISYQGRLADSGGNPLTGKYNLEFRIYDVPTGGAPLWTEMWTGSNAVDVSDGLFNVMLGSIDNTLASSIEGEDELYLGITVGTDSEMVPRVQLGSVPFSMHALTVADGSITTAKIADGAVTQAKLGTDVSLVPPDGSITSEKLALTYDGYATWLGTQEVSGPGWEEVSDTNYRPLTITVDGPTVLDVSATATLLSSELRAALQILVDGVVRCSAYVTADGFESASCRQLVPVEAGSHTISVEVGSWDSTIVHVHGAFSLSAIAFGR